MDKKLGEVDVGRVGWIKSLETWVWGGWDG